jgi:CRISPR-associated protein Csb2
MLAIDVEFLTGSYVATKFDNRRKAEWPPHPARLFAALVAAWADGDELDEQERAALEELEALPPPRVLVDDNPSFRSIVDHYVPDNDVTALASDTSGLYARRLELLDALKSGLPDSKENAKAAKALNKHDAKIRSDSAKYGSSNGKESASQIEKALRILPEYRTRQARTFPTVIPADPRVRFEWEAEQFANISALAAVTDRVHRLGHSSSFVRCSVAFAGSNKPSEPTEVGWAMDNGPREWLVPSDAARMTRPLRVPARGMTRRLVDAYAIHQGSEGRVTPHQVAMYAKASMKPELRSSVHSGTMIVVPFPGAIRPPISRVVELALALHGALLRHSPEQPAPPILSGHEAGVRPTPSMAGTHMAIVGLPFVGFGRADGRLHGLAVVVPKAASPDDEALIRHSVSRWRAESATLRTARSKVTLADEVITPTHTMRVNRWARPSRRWATATPIVLDRFPKGRTALDIGAEVIARSCEAVGLPTPAEVSVSNDPVIVGSRPVRGFPAYSTPKGNRPMVHAIIEFAEPIEGPLLLGAGRYFGMGFCIPLDDLNAEDGSGV